MEVRFIFGAQAHFVGLVLTGLEAGILFRNGGPIFGEFCGTEVAAEGSVKERVHAVHVFSFLCGVTDVLLGIDEFEAFGAEFLGC